MKRLVFTKENFNDLTQFDRIEYLLRKEAVVKNIKQSFPLFEILGIVGVLAYSRIYTVMMLTALSIPFKGLSANGIALINAYSLFFNAVIVILFISFIARIMIYFLKCNQLNELHSEFLDRLSLNMIKAKRVKRR